MTSAQYNGIIAALQGIGSVSVPGAIIMFGGAVTPTGYLPCDGAAVSRSTYSALFAAIGVAWGAGNASTTFNVPDLRGRSPLGVGTGAGLTARALAATGGEEGHALSAAENGPHTHNVTDPGHGHSLADGDFVHDGTMNGPIYNEVAATGGGTDGSTNAAVTNLTVDSQGSGTAHNTMHPFSAVNFYVKT